jgi:integrase/recombinase XerD
MLMSAVDAYLAIRRAAGFALIPIEGYLRAFARFATAHGDTHVVVRTAIDWATLAPSEAQRHYRLQTVVRFACFMAAEDSRHAIPPTDVFRGRRPRPTPYIFSDEEIGLLVGHARRLRPPPARYGHRPTVPCLGCSPSPGCGWRKPAPSTSRM